MGPNLTSRTYDVLKFVSLVLLPAAASAYFALAQVWPLPYVQQIVGTITIIDTFLGLLLKGSSSKYKELIDNPPIWGDLYVRTDYDGAPTGDFRLSAKMDNVVFDTTKMVGLRVKREIVKRPGESPNIAS